jgi:chromosome segregation protein
MRAKPLLSPALKMEGGIPALRLLRLINITLPLCNYLLKGVYLVDDDKDQAKLTAALPQGVVLIGKSGKFNKSKHTMAGGSVGLFEGKRIGRAKNLENLAKEIKGIENQVGTSRKPNLTNCKASLRLYGHQRKLPRSTSSK